MTICKFVLLGAVAALPLLAAPVLAQNAATTTPDVGTQVTAADNAPPEMIVTARKRSEKLQDVPISITAFDSDEIKSARIERLGDLAKLTPGLNFTPLFGAQNQLPIIRGAAQTFGALNVGIFLDGIYLSGKAAADLELNDLARIEVVKGPQSALYGRNTFAGAINYVTARPTEAFSGNIAGTVAEDGFYRLQGSLSGQITSGIRARIGGYYREFGGWYTSSVDGGAVDFTKSYGGIATVELQPSDALRVTVRGSYSNDDNGQPPSNVIRNNSFEGVPSGAPASQRRNLLYVGRVPSIPQGGVNVNTLPVAGLPGGSFGDREEIYRASGDIEYDFGGVALTSITAYAKRNVDYTFDGDNNICDRANGCPNFGFPFAPPIPFGKSDFALSSLEGSFRDISQELRLASNNDGPLQWLVGAFYYNNRTIGIDRNIGLPSALAITDYIANAAAYRFPRNQTDTKSIAGFGSVNYQLTDKFGVTAELRYEHETVNYLQAPTRTGTTGSTAVFDLAATFDFWTPRVILNYKANDDLLLFASYARGAKTGGFNTNTNINADQRAYFPEYSNNFEIGLKSDLLDRKLRFNMSGYYTDWQDQQAACQNPITSGGTSTQRTYVCNVAASKIYGVEIDVVANISDWFSVTGNYTYTHARYTKFVDDSLATTLVLAGLPPINFNGNSLPYVPDHKVVVSPRINVPLGSAMTAELRADLVMQSETFVRADNLQSFAPFETVDLRATLRSGGISLQAYVNNLFDVTTPVAGVRFFDATNFSVASPYVQGANRRQFGATLGYRF